MKAVTVLAGWAAVTIICCDILPLIFLVVVIAIIHA